VAALVAFPGPPWAGSRAHMVPVPVTDYNSN